MTIRCTRTVCSGVPATGKKPVHEVPPATVAVGRRVFLGMAALAALGVAFGAKVQHTIGRALGPGLGGLLPGADQFRLYTITNSYPEIPRDEYRLSVSGLVTRPTIFTVDDLEAVPRTSLVRQFQCVTGWVVPDVH